MKLSDFHFDLPEELIAQKPIRPRDHSKLMVLKEDSIEHKHFYDITDYFQDGDVLVVNEAKVSRAKIVGKKTTGGPVETILTKKLSEDTYECRVKGYKPKKGDKHLYPNDLEGEIIDQKEHIRTIKFNRPITEQETKSFELPTPPYVDRKIEDEDEYQTTYSKTEGSVAAPTAGFHFTEEMIKKLKDKGVKFAKITLHIDFGTFLPIMTTIEQHQMHEEHFEISKEAAETINNRKGRLFVVGTTSLRALESSTENNQVIPTKSSTDIFIYPGYEFKKDYDGMITNFHLPESTLILLVSALFGKDRLLKAYNEAIKEKYRFYSFGDAMFLRMENSHPQ